MSPNERPRTFSLSIVHIATCYLLFAHTLAISPDSLHPLDTITLQELSAAVEVSRTKAIEFMTADGSAFVFSSVALKTPPKYELLPHFLADTEPPPGSIPRVAHVCLFHRGTMRVFEAEVDVTSPGNPTLLGWEEMPYGLQPLTSLNEEGEEIPHVAIQDPGVQARFAALGITNMSRVIGDTWFYVHNDERAEFKGRRIAQVFFYVKNFEGDNHFAHPVGFIVIVNMRTSQVLDIYNLPIHEDYDIADRKGDSIPKGEYQYDPALRDPSSYRPRVKPIEVSQPEGVNYKVTGTLVEWQNWKFRVSFNAREGLIINTLSYNDGGKHRPLFYKMHLSELNLNYADPRPPFHRKIPFDVGHYGLGVRANVLSSPDDCRGESVFFDGVGHMGDGTPKLVKNAVCVSEDDGGVLWRKGSPYSGKTARVFTVRANRLAVTWITTSGNYDYQFTWYFYQDASIRKEVRLNGIVNPNMIAAPAEGQPWEPPHNHRHGTIMAPQLNGINHQHVFAFRLDANIDGELNNIYTVDVEPDTPLENAKHVGIKDWGNGWGPVNKLLTTVAEGRSYSAPEKGRAWLISIPGKRHPISGTLVGYKLVPENLPNLMLRKDSPLHPLVEFGDYDLWTLPYQPGQQYAAGFYVNNSGLGEWTRQRMEDSIVEKDLVLWHIFRVTHVPRVEDFPIMPTEVAGFTLKPVNFFGGNPAFDIRPIETGRDYVLKTRKTPPTSTELPYESEER